MKEFLYMGNIPSFIGFRQMETYARVRIMLARLMNDGSPEGNSFQADAEELMARLAELAIASPGSTHFMRVKGNGFVATSLAELNPMRAMI